MAQNSKIEWTHHTANLWHGCTKVHAGCDHCYAETLSNRWGRDIWGNDKPRMEIKSVWNDLKKYQLLAAATGEMHRVFVGSMMDIFEKPMTLVDNKGEMVTDGFHHYPADTGQLRDQLFEEIEEGKYQNLLFLFLTKRPSNINKYIPESWKNNPPENVMFGTSPCDQKTADTLIPQLLQVNGKRFLSIEPLLGPVDLSEFISLTDSNHAYTEEAEKRGWGYDSYSGGFAGAGTHDALYDPKSGLDWVIVGGESGHGARPMHPDWVRSLRDQCKEAEVPFFFKQWGEFVEGAKGSTDINKWNMVGEDGVIYNDVVPSGKNCKLMTKVGKKEAGRLLDGELYDEFPILN